MKVKSFVLCEQVRQENTGKFMLIGVFGTDAIVNNLPTETRWINPVFLSIFSTLEVDRETDAGLYIVKDEVFKVVENEVICPICFELMIVPMH